MFVTIIIFEIKEGHFYLLLTLIISAALLVITYALV